MLAQYQFKLHNRNTTTANNGQLHMFRLSSESDYSESEYSDFCIDEFKKANIIEGTIRPYSSETEVSSNIYNLFYIPVMLCLQHLLCKCF